MSKAAYVKAQGQTFTAYVHGGASGAIASVPGFASEAA